MYRSSSDPAHGGKLFVDALTAAADAYRRRGVPGSPDEAIGAIAAAILQVFAEGERRPERLLQAGLAVVQRLAPVPDCGLHFRRGVDGA